MRTLSKGQRAVLKQLAVEGCVRDAVYMEAGKYMTAEVLRSTKIHKNKELIIDVYDCLKITHKQAVALENLMYDCSDQTAYTKMCKYLKELP